MMNVHLAPEDENEDLYSGYDYNDPMLEVWHLCLCIPIPTNLFSRQGLDEDPEFQRIIRTTHGQRPPLPVGAHGGNLCPQLNLLLGTRTPTWHRYEAIIHKDRGESGHWQ